MYTTVLFDADDTLLDFKKSEQTALIETFEQCSLPTDDDFIKSYKRINDGLWERFNKGEIEKTEITDTRFVLLFKEHGIRLDGKEMNKRYLCNLSKYGFLLDGAYELCHSLHKKGLRLYIITNGVGPVQKSRFEKSGLKRFFEDVFISEDIGEAKPLRGFFDYVYEHIEEKDKEKIIVVGDSLSADITGGKDYGFVTCWCNFRNMKDSDKPDFCAKSFSELERIITG